jgi:hypothetical protein
MVIKKRRKKKTEKKLKGKIKRKQWRERISKQSKEKRKKETENLKRKKETMDGGLHRSWTVSGGAAGSQSVEEKPGEDDVLVALEEFTGKGK